MGAVAKVKRKHPRLDTFGLGTSRKHNTSEAGQPRLLIFGHYQHLGCPFIRVFCAERETWGADGITVSAPRGRVDLKQVVSYLGLNPQEHSSGGKKRLDRNPGTRDIPHFSGPETEADVAPGLLKLSTGHPCDI
jgi:hypothetical protein